MCPFSPFSLERPGLAMKQMICALAAAMFLWSPVWAAPGGRSGGGGDRNSGFGKHFGGGSSGGSQSFTKDSSRSGSPSFQKGSSHSDTQPDTHSDTQSITKGPAHSGTHSGTFPITKGPAHSGGYPIKKYTGHPGGYSQFKGSGHPSGHPYGKYQGYPSRQYGHPGHPGGWTHYDHSHWYHGHWNPHWVRPWPLGPTAWFSVGLATGSVLWDAPWRWGYWSYYNPYYVDVVVVDGARIDYSQPIALASVPSDETAGERAAQLLDAARDAFARADYPAAMTLVDRAVAKQPNDPALHEFRALVLFAMKQYKPAAEVVYAVLSNGPGWDWATLIGFYPDPNVYTEQLRALEQYRGRNPGMPEIRFLLAYHYLSCGHEEAAADELREVVRLNPKDQLAAQLLAGLTGDPPAAGPAIAPPAASSAMPAATISAAALTGNWTATRPDGASIALALTDGGTYTWQFVQKDRTQQFDGTFTVADNLLILKRDGNPTLIGQVTMLDGRRFNFKLVGGGEGDPGLTFEKDDIHAPSF